MALAKYLGESFRKESDDLNSQIEMVETVKDKMTSKFRKGLIKFSESAPEIVACQGDITDDMKDSVDKMYQYFKRADEIATDCNSEVSTALELSAVLKKKIREKEDDLECDLSRKEREKEDAEDEKDRIKKRIKDARDRVDSAKEDVKKADRDETRGMVAGAGMTGAATAAGATLGALLGGPFGLLIGGGLMGGVSGAEAVEAVEELERRVDDAKSALSSRENELENKEEELEKIRDEIRKCKIELKSINECLGQIEDLDRKVRRDQKHVANLSTHIKNCLTVIRTTVGKSEMLRDECLSEMVTFNALVKIVNDLALHFKGENLQDFLSATQNDSMTTAIKNIERTSCGSVSMAKRARVEAPGDDFMEV